MKAILEEKHVPEEMLSDVLEGLCKPQKTLPSKYLYDQRGSGLFEQICELDEYYLTRTELKIMRDNIQEIANDLGENIQLVEPGSGNSLKTRLLLDHLENTHSYIPVDISKRFLDEAAENLQIEYPGLKIQPVAADYTRSLQLPELRTGLKRVIYFPGSTIGNFTKENAENFIGVMANSINENGGLLIGFDLIKDHETLLAAYNDSEGVTALFNKNILRRINNELGGDFDLSQFEHKAVFNEEKSRIEMHLISSSRQTVRISNKEISFYQGETIHTENSHKYTLSSFRCMTEPYFKTIQTWTDDNNQFAIQYLSN